MAISIHAPAWGATGQPRCIRLRCRYFNPRTRVGCDCTRRITLRGMPNFNPRTRVGCDIRALIMLSPEAYFNPRTRVGCDQDLRSWSVAISLFQSTHPRGVRRVAEALQRVSVVISIHAPAWGATSSRKATVFDIKKFQSTHPRGVRPKYNNRKQLLFEFQSTHPRGVRQGAKQK